MAPAILTSVTSTGHRQAACCGDFGSLQMASKENRCHLCVLVLFFPLLSFCSRTAATAPALSRRPSQRARERAIEKETGKCS